MSLPEPPVNVRLLFANGQQVAVDTIFIGRGEDGINNWQVLNVPPALQIVSVLVDELPAMTAVHIDRSV
jgi:hypothetical protein